MALKTTNRNFMSGKATQLGVDGSRLASSLRARKPSANPIANAWWAIVPVAVVLAATSCSPASVPSPLSTAMTSPVPTQLIDTPCDDLIDAAQAAPAPPNDLQPSSTQVFIGSRDTFFIGTLGRRWGENVEYYGGTLRMKIGIYTLDTHPPRVSVVRTDGRANGHVEFAPTSQGLPGPLPTGLSFPTAGCWKVEARGATGLATIEVSVHGAPAPSTSPTPS